MHPLANESRRIHWHHADHAAHGRPPGTMVHQGDVMFVMDHKPFQASLDAARAEFAQIQRSQLQDQQLTEIVALYKVLGYGLSVDAGSPAPSRG
jgi:hypothetical protein